MLAVMSSAWYQFVVLLLALWSLFMVDFRFIFLPASSDIYYDRISEVVFILFTVEFAVNCVFQKEYVNSFFFYIDLLSVISMGPDTPFVWNGVKEMLKSEELPFNQRRRLQC